MIVDKACPRVFASIHTDTSMNDSRQTNSDITACLINKQQSAWAYRHLNIRANLITHIREKASIQFRTDKEACLTRIETILSQGRNSHQSYCQN